MKTLKVSTELSKSEIALLSRVVRFNAVVTAMMMGLIAGALLWLATLVLLLRDGANVGAHLALLAVFFPGYSVTWTGAWVGLFWGLVFGALSGAVLYWTYARSLRAGLTRQMLDHPAAGGLQPPTFLLSGRALGTGLGAIVALQLFLTTNWLVVRGTASYSENAALLGQYLPGYTVSWIGSLIGGAELFAIAFAASIFVSGIYNAIARSRAGK